MMFGVKATYSTLIVFLVNTSKWWLFF